MTVLKSLATDRDVQIRNEALGGRVVVNVIGIIRTEFYRDEFAQAVRDLGFIVIEKAKWPEVTRDGEYIEVNDEAERINVVRERREELERTAHENLALVAWIDSNPPVDPKVEALASFLHNHGDGGVWESFDTEASQEVARALVTHFDIKEPS